MEELFHPLEAYRDRLKKEHARNVREAFEALVAEAGTDEAANPIGTVAKCNTA